MGRAGKWLRSFLTGKKERDREKKDDGDRSGVRAGAPPAAEDKPAPAATPPPPKEKRRWSFRRSVGGGRDLNSPEPTANAPVRHAGQDPETEQMRHAVAAAAGAAVAAAQAAAAVIRLTAASAPGRSGAVEEAAAAVKIQSIFRAYLARKALRALKGLVKLQALVRGHLVRKQATATLRCMQALVTAQARARAQRIRMAEDAPAATPLQRQPTHRRSPLDPRHRSQPYEMDGDLEDDIKIVEMDLGESKGSTKSRSSYSITQADRSDHRPSSASYYGAAPRAHSIPDLHLPAATSPSPSALTDMSPRACSGHFEEFSFPTAQSTPHYHSSAAVSKLVAGKPPPGAARQEEHGYCSPMSNDHPLFPNYMANTESSKAKSRSQSAPKQRPEITCERPPSRRRPSVEGRSIPRGSVRMQRSSSHVGCSATNGYQYPWTSLKLDRSSVSLKDSECGSTSTALTNTIYCKSLVSYEIYGTRY